MTGGMLMAERPRTERPTLGALLEEQRQSLGWTLEIAAAETGVGAATISQIERSQIESPSFATILSLCEGYGLSVDAVADLVLGE